MSILVKGMKMPESCKACRIDGRECSRWQDFLLWKSQRAPDCPLLFVSEHGDLIDQDEYREEFMNGVYELCSDDPDNNRANAIIDLFDSAPAVIPADEEVKKLKTIKQLNMSDMAEVIAAHFNVKPEQVRITIEPICRGYGMAEHTEYSASCTVDISTIGDDGEL